MFDIIFKDLDREEASKCKICEWKKQHDAEGKGKKDEQDE